MNLFSDRLFASSYLAIDIGNSRIKIFGDSPSGETKLSLFYRNDWLEQVSAFIRRDKEYIIGISSVKSSVYNEIFRVLNFRSNLKLFSSEFLLTNQNLIDISSVQGIGSDRVFGLIGAASEYKPPLLTIDFGSAITINLLDADYKCLGGVILPGLHTQFASLEAATGLKGISPSLPINIIGANTNTAVSSGIYNSIAYSVNGFISDFCNETFKNQSVRIILTGGDSEVFCKMPEISKFKPEVEPFLIPKGILHILRILNLEN